MIDGKLEHSVALMTRDPGLVEEVRECLDAIGLEGALVTAGSEPELAGESLVLLDADTFGLSPLEGLRGGAFVVVISSQAGTRYLIESMTFGAYDCILRPLSGSALGSTVRRALGTVGELGGELVEYKGDVEGSGVTCAIVGTSPVLQEVCKRVGSVGRVDIPILITGETGTGKDLVAESVWKVSTRWEQPFVVLNCAAIPETLLEAELFGHEKGAFTGADSRKRGKFEEADGGIIFLDEIGDMSVQLQAKVLRVLQNGTFHRIGGSAEIRTNVRVIAATNQDLGGLIASGAFREDLYYRINVVHIHLPPLRERTEDIPLLVECFVRRHSSIAGKDIRGVSRAFLERLLAHPWPGNIRELENTVRRAIAFASTPWLTTFDLEIGGLVGRDTAAAVPAAGPVQGAVRESVKGLLRPGAEDGKIFGRVLKDTERVLIEEALAICGGNRSRAARMLGINRLTLRRKIQEYGLSPPDAA